MGRSKGPDVFLKSAVQFDCKLLFRATRFECQDARIRNVRSTRRIFKDTAEVFLQSLATQHFDHSGIVESLEKSSEPGPVPTKVFYAILMLRASGLLGGWEHRL